MPATAESNLLNINLDEIIETERILLPVGKSFDAERRRFIKNFETIDLQAVPGSGKTTALLAKLLILEKRLPLSSNRGILILSHTNTAVDEIKDKIGIHCSKLFSYPNFIGTVQSFVDQFLAIPCYSNLFKQKTQRIDNEIFEEQFNKSISYGARLALNHRLKDNYSDFIKNIFVINEVGLVDIFSFEEKIINKLGNHTPTYQEIISVKKNLLKKGILNFNDAFAFAKIYLERHPKIIKILQRRFQYIFIDETQDLEMHQYDLLENIFYDRGNSTSIIQRIGDINQAIFSNEVHHNSIWNLREGENQLLAIKGSKRLTPKIAELVNCFALKTGETFAIEGKNENCDLKPHMIVYSTDKIKDVIPKFSEIVNNYISSGVIEIKNSSKIKAIGWSKSSNNINHYKIADYYDSFTLVKTKTKIDYENLDSYLVKYNKESSTLTAIRNNILNALVKILRLEGLYHTKLSLLNYIKEKNETEYLVFKKHLYQWSIDIIRNKFIEVYNSIKTYSTEFLNIFELRVNHSRNFIQNQSQNIENEEIRENLTKENILNFHGFDIEVGTIHSAKGETHLATLYLETFYGKGNGNYESQRLASQFKYQNFSDQRAQHIQSTKMAYVGFSRPTHLLCVAIQKERFEANLSDIDRDKWAISTLE